MHEKKRIDWALVISLMVLMAVGLASLFSSDPHIATKQIIWIVIALAVAVFLYMVDLRSFFGHRGFVLGIYLVVIILLLITLFIAPTIKGNRAWFVIGSFQFQPSEFAKVALILVLAYFFSKQHIGIGRWRVVFASLIYFAIPAVIIAKQPDLGSAIVLFCIWVGFVLLSGLPAKKIAISGAILVVALGVMWAAVLHPYQKERIIGVFVPERDPLGVNYSVIQSKIAIGSGGVFGKGLGQGTQVQLGFLPEAQTDFIFAAIAEEGGLVAVVVLLGALLWMMLRILKIGMTSEGNFLKFVCLGTVVMFCAQIVLHIGANMGLVPVIGVTLPFVSYGGSSLLANMILIGIIQSMHVRSY